MRGQIWCLFFTSVVSFQYHPGTKQRLSLVECAAIADEMLQLAMSRGDLWL